MCNRLLDLIGAHDQVHRLEGVADNELNAGIVVDHLGEDVWELKGQLIFVEVSVKSVHDFIHHLSVCKHCP